MPESLASTADLSCASVIGGSSNRLRADFSRAYCTVAAQCRTQATWKVPIKRVRKTGITKANSTAVAPLSLRGSGRRLFRLANTDHIALRDGVRLQQAGVGARPRKRDEHRRQARAPADPGACDRRGATGAGPRDGDQSI